MEKEEQLDFEDGSAYIGLMRWKEGEPFEYWIGMFLAENAAVPEGFAFLDFPASDLGVTWLYGKESELYAHEEECAESCEKAGYQMAADSQGAFWFFERYSCSRFTTPDVRGNVILDLCHFIQK